MIMNQHDITPVPTSTLQELVENDPLLNYDYAFRGADFVDCHYLLQFAATSNNMLRISVFRSSAISGHVELCTKREWEPWPKLDFEAEHVGVHYLTEVALNGIDNAVRTALIADGYSEEQLLVLQQYLAELTLTRGVCQWMLQRWRGLRELRDATEDGLFRCGMSESVGPVMCGYLRNGFTFEGLQFSHLSRLESTRGEDAPFLLLRIDCSSPEDEQPLNDGVDFVDDLPPDSAPA
jgi:hypothetical protein